MTHSLTRSIAALILLGSANLSWASLINFEFRQDGFSDGAFVSGSFRGRDLDGDGQLYAVSRGISEIFGLPFGNELDYAEVTFTGFGSVPGPSTVVYDRSVADMESPRNFFMSFAYNIDGGPIGDDPDEGMALAIFSPSTNYIMGGAFYPTPWGLGDGFSQDIGTCGVDPLCANVISYLPDPDDPSSAFVVFESFSGNAVETTAVPLPSVASLMLVGLGGIFGSRRRTQQRD